jgi:hypothetical protein
MWNNQSEKNSNLLSADTANVQIKLFQVTGNF